MSILRALALIAATLAIPAFSADAQQVLRPGNAKPASRSVCATGFSASPTFFWHGGATHAYTCSGRVAATPVCASGLTPYNQRAAGKVNLYDCGEAPG
jgi:hypothetical protein